VVRWGLDGGRYILERYAVSRLALQWQVGCTVHSHNKHSGVRTTTRRFRVMWFGEYKFLTSCQSGECLKKLVHTPEHCSKIWEETLLNSVSNDLLPFSVGQSHDIGTQHNFLLFGSTVTGRLVQWTVRPLLNSPNKHCSKIWQETLLNSVSNDLLPFRVRQSHDSFILLSVKDVMLFQHCQHVHY
jgi:hypothetical protein